MLKQSPILELTPLWMVLMFDAFFAVAVVVVVVVVVVVIGSFGAIL